MPKTAGRDPVCEAIEALLRDLETQGKGTLETSEADGSVVISFGGIRVVGLSHDVTLVRLAMAMMDDQRYSALLMDALHDPMQESD